MVLMKKRMKTVVATMLMKVNVNEGDCESECECEVIDM